MRVRGTKKCGDAGERRCTVVAGSGISEELWIDPSTYRVRRSVVTERNGVEEKIAGCTFDSIRLGGDIEPERFRFTPPPGAAATNALPLP